MPLPADERIDLERSLRGSLTESPETLDRLARDGSHLVGDPSAAVAPEDAEDLQELVRWARRHRRGLVPRGGGTSLDGESVPLHGSVVVDLSGWNRILEIDAEGRTARVQPGVVNHDLHRALADSGLQFPPNPGSWWQSTIGGNAATNASGPRSFRYGSTRRWVRSAEVVLGTGDRLGLGSRALKRSVGPELLSLFIGSEGTIGIFTELSVGLVRRPARRVGVAVPLPRSTSLGRIVLLLRGDDALGLSAVEYLDATCAAALRDLPGSRLPAPEPTLLLELEAANEAEESDRLERLAGRLAELAIPEEPLVYPDADALWTLRGESGTALAARVGPTIREDIAVPVARLDLLVEAIAKIAADHRVPVHTFGHVGEANLHPNFAVDPGGRTADSIRTALYEATQRLGGTISGEHGIGRIKAPHLALELGAPGVDAVRGIKRLFDPDGILNPGKLFPDA